MKLKHSQVFKRCRPASELLTVGLAAGGLGVRDSPHRYVCERRAYFNNDQKYLDFPYQQCTGYNSAYVRYGSTTVRYADKHCSLRIPYGTPEQSTLPPWQLCRQGSRVPLAVRSR